MDHDQSLLSVVFKVIGVEAPECLAKCPHDNVSDELSLLFLDKGVVDKDKRPECQEPDVVLRCHDFVEDDKAPRLDETSSEQVIVEGDATCDDKCPLWNEGQDSNQS